MHLTRNQAYLYGYRGFESLPLRQFLHHQRAKETEPMEDGSLMNETTVHFLVLQQLEFLLLVVLFEWRKRIVRRGS
jgi:hypothetical protein